jgi:flagellar biosynthesis anti-sigma factor FlgM
MRTDNPKRSLLGLQSDGDGGGPAGSAGAEKDEAHLTPEESAAKESEPEMAGTNANEGLRMGKIAEIRQAVADGSYKIDPLKVADKLIEHIVDLSQRPIESEDPLKSDQDPKQPGDA